MGLVCRDKSVLSECGTQHCCLHAWHLLLDVAEADGAASVVGWSRELRR